MKFNDVETYLEFMAGFKDINAQLICNMFSVLHRPFFIKLNAYDAKFVNSVATQIMDGISLTDRQAVLAERLIVQHATSLTALGVDQPDNFTYRMPIRKIDRSAGVYISDNFLYFKFPFNEKIIAQIKVFKPNAQGVVDWVPDKKIWKFSLTEFNLNWVVSVALANNYIVDKEVLDIFNEILLLEKTAYNIELTINEHHLPIITNAADSLLEYLNDNNAFDNIYSLLDFSGLLGYTINRDIKQVLINEHSEAFIKCCESNSIDNCSLKDVLNYATIVGRYPICVINPNLTPIDQNVFNEYFDESEILIMPKSKAKAKEINIDEKIKLVYTIHTLPQWLNKIPLLISYANLMHGTEKKEFLALAEKVAYCCTALPRSNIRFPNGNMLFLNY